MKIKKIYILFLLAIFSTSNLWATMDETDRNQKPSGKAPALDVAKSFEEIAFERSFELAGRAPALDVAKSFELAADQGDMESQHRLGVMLYQGDGIPKDQERAAKYFQLAADQGYMKSQYSLGICFS